MTQDFIKLNHCFLRAIGHGRQEKVRMRLLAMLVALASMPLLSSAQNTEEWPDFPLLNVSTVNAEMPTATLVDPPESCFGQGIVSEYVPGRLVMTLGGKTMCDTGEYEKGESGMRIKIRGNTSGAYLDQHPYKLKLSKKADLLGIDKKLKNKNWALLSMYANNKVMRNSESDILPLAGLAVCSALEFPWTPRTRLVNLVLNGEYQGMYHLIETVERGDERVATDKTGFLIENDAYWWKEGEVYFKTDRQHPGMGYTFKYPDADDVDDNIMSAIRDYMNKVETAVYTHDGVADYIDYESFARWVLCHDILGTLDSGGSNMFLYKESFGKDEPSEAKLKMATPWDFDSILMCGDTDWGAHHVSVLNYYPELFKEKDFCEQYIALYKNYRDKVYPYVADYFDNLKAESGEAFEQSRTLHRKVYTEEMKSSLDEQVDDVLSHLKSRLEAFDALVADLEEQVSGVDHVTGSESRVLKRRVGIDGADYTGVSCDNLPQGIYIERCSDGTARKRMVCK